MVYRNARALHVVNALLLMFLIISLLIAYQYHGPVKISQTKVSRITQANSTALRSGSGCQPGPGAYCVGGNLAGSQLDFKDLDQIDFEGAILAGSNLEYSSMSHANLVRANLAGSNLRSTYLVGANLTSASLVHSNMTGVVLAFADLRNANLDYTDLSGASLKGRFSR